ncbi:hypothetical protein [Streptomyces sp. NPDC001480]
MKRIIPDLLAGPGGWSHALTVPGPRDIGLEWDSSITGHTYRAG